ncbi:MAG TPA: helix-turn-helix domain-containing protein [Candidatus Acidoferrum sp.]|nr:helix-turn-helix domain-containing protein [Candidatus Acidoferrum sp.]
MQDTKLRGISEVAERLGVSRATVWRQIKLGHIRSVRIGTRVLVSDAELARLAQQGTEIHRVHQ